MLKHPTYDQLYALGLHGMAKALVEIAAASEADGLGHHEWLGLLLDREASWRQDKRLAGSAPFIPAIPNAVVLGGFCRTTFYKSLGREAVRFRGIVAVWYYDSHTCRS